MCRFLIFFVFLLLLSGCDPVAMSQTKIQDATIRSAEKTSQLAINFYQGDINSLIDAEDDFTPEGWSKFMNRLTGYLDEKGSPNFSQSFNKSGEPLDVRRENLVYSLVNIELWFVGRCLI